MSNLNLDENSSMYQIRSYEPGAIKVNDMLFTHSIIISPRKLIDHWAPETTDDLSQDAFADIIALKPDILLIGTGGTHVFIPIELYGELINHGIGVEVMNTSAASRTFNALCAEDRNVVAALLIR